MRVDESAGAAPSDLPRPAVGFYFVTDARYFTGAVALINSLRLVGHDEPVFVLDCGLTWDQRALLGPAATLVPSHESRPPTLRKAVAPMLCPAQVMVLLDTDVLVVQHLADFLGTARGGKIVGFPDVLHVDRHFAE